MKQTQVVTVKLILKRNQAPYSLLEGKRKYNALRHFFEDIGYKVQSVTSETNQTAKPVSAKCETFSELLETLAGNFDRVSFQMPDELPIVSWHVQSVGDRVIVTVSDSDTSNKAILVSGEAGDTMAIIRCPHCGNESAEAENFTYLPSEQMLECGQCGRMIEPA